MAQTDIPIDLTTLTAQYRDEMIAFCQQIVQIPSMPGEEGDVAAAIEAEMRRLAYDEVWVDDWGNVIGRLAGGDGSSVMFNGHMDHVDPGNPDDWPYPPFGAEIHEGRLWGRGTADMKGPLAAMIYAVGALARERIRPAGDVIVAAVVQEERGGVGSRGLVEGVRTDYAVVGEPSSNRLARGHRGRHEPVVTVRGRSVHGSVPHEGVNPHAVLARFIQALEKLPMASDSIFGSSTVAPTLYRIDQKSSNVIPGEARLHLDWRAIPDESAEDAIEQLEPLLDAALAQVAGSQGAIEIASYHARTYTGQELDVPLAMDGYVLDMDEPLLIRSRQILEAALERSVDVISWAFGTDATRLMPAGIQVIGFGASEAAPIHTVRESVPLDMLAEGLKGYMALALELGREA